MRRTAIRNSAESKKLKISTKGIGISLPEHEYIRAGIQNLNRFVFTKMFRFCYADRNKIIFFANICFVSVHERKQRNLRQQKGFSFFWPSKEQRKKLSEMKKSVIAILFLMFAAATLYADNNSDLVEKGNKAYSSKFYQQAIECYEKVIKNGFEAPELYYNLGNAYFKQADYSSAILYFEKAKRLKPGDEDIEHNLKVANTKITDKIDAIPEFFLVRWWKEVRNIFPFNTWAILGIVFLITGLGLFGFYLFSSVLKRRKIAFWLTFVFMIMMAFSFISAQSQYSSVNSVKEAIVFSPSVTAKSSPDANSTDLFVIHEGSKVKVIDNVGEWSEIKIANGSVGWVNTSVFKII